MSSPQPVQLKNRNPVQDKSSGWARLALGALLVVSLGVLALYRWIGDSEPPIEPVSLDNVTVPVSRTPHEQIVVYVVGEVNRPGVVSLPAGSRVVDAIKAAGGLTERANQFAVNLAARLRDEEMVKVYAQGEVVPEAPGPATPSETPVEPDYPPGDAPPPAEPPPVPPDLTPPPPAGHFQGGEIPPAPPGPALTPPPPTGGPPTPAAGDPPKPPGGPPPAPPLSKVSLNRGTVEQLEAIPGLGPKLAGQIVAYRRGPPPRAFTTLEDLIRVPGIKQAKLDEVRPFITL